MDKAISSEKYRQLNELLKERRISEGYSMRDFAKKINEPHSFVQKVEASQRKLDIFQYVQYCQALGLDPSKVLKLLEK